MNLFLFFNRFPFFKKKNKSFLNVYAFENSSLRFYCILVTRSYLLCYHGFIGVTVNIVHHPDFNIVVVAACAIIEIIKKQNLFVGFYFTPAVLNHRSGKIF